MLLYALFALFAAVLPAQIPTQSAPVVTLDRDRIGIDESFTLTVEIDDSRVGERFDTSPLRDGDFVILRHESRQEAHLQGGRNRLRTIYSFELAPRRTGRLTVPPLRIGGAWTRPLVVSVSPPGDRNPPPVPPPDSVAFIETLLEERTPYVQQNVGYTLRLYYDGNVLIDGTLIQDPPQNADFFKVGEDLHFHRQIGERIYKVLERRYSLVPAQAGPLVLPAPRFEGHVANSRLDDLFGGGRRRLRVVGPQHTLQARSIPAQAPQPWLPLRAVRMSWLQSPRELRSGEAATVTLRMVVDGAGAGQLPELDLKVAEGDAHVFPDVLRSEERFIDGRLQTTLTRSFSVVPSTLGSTLVLRGSRLSWWDTGVGTSRTTGLPDLRLAVASPGQVAALGAGAATALPEPPGAMKRRWNRVRAWYAEDPVLRLAWTALLATWGLVMALVAWSRLRAHRRKRADTARAQQAERAQTARAHVYDAAALRRLFAAADLAEIARTLCALAMPPAADLDRLRARLADPAQREAIVLLQRARWGSGDANEARRALREAFAEGPRWLSAPSASTEPPLLPPLYPA